MSFVSTVWRATSRPVALHKFATDLVRRFDVTSFKDLNASGLTKNQCLARALSDTGLGQAGRTANALVRIDRLYPSSTTCPGCGHRLDDLPLSVRHWACSECEAVPDRY